MRTNKYLRNKNHRLKLEARVKREEPMNPMYLGPYWFINEKPLDALVTEYYVDREKYIKSKARFYDRCNDIWYMPKRWYKKVISRKFRARSKQVLTNNEWDDMIFPENKKTVLWDLW